jgi:hypothetical protein
VRSHTGTRARPRASNGVFRALVPVRTGGLPNELRVSRVMPPRIPPPAQEFEKGDEEVGTPREDEEELEKEEDHYAGRWPCIHSHCLCCVRAISWCRFPLGNTSKVAWKIPFFICSVGVALLIYYTATRAATITAQENSAG